MYRKIDLSEYKIKNGIRLYQFCDVLLEKNTANKSKFLDNIGISYNSFKQEKRVGNVSEKNKTINTLLDKFNYKYIDYELDGIESVLEDIIDQAFLKDNGKSKEYLEFLNEYILNKDVLEPVYILFKVILVTFNEHSYNKSLINLEKELDYLQLFVEKKYFTNNLEFLLKCILFYFNKYDDTIDIDNLAIKNNDFIWIYYEIRGGKALIEKNYPIMQVNYDKALELYEKNYNFRRVLSITNNFCYYYNNIGQFLTSLEYSKKLIFNPNLKQIKKLHSFVIMHHLFSLLMLNDYMQIISIYDKLVDIDADINDFSYAIYVLSKIIENNNFINNVENNNNIFVEWIIDYINTQDKKKLLSSTKSEYEEKFVTIIISEFK